MVTTAALLLCALMAALATFQLALALGAPLGHLAWGGRHRVLPRPLRVGSVVSVGAYAVIAVVVASRAGLADPGWSAGFVSVAVWVVVGYFLLGVGVNLASRSRPERVVMSPLCAVLWALATVVALA